MSADLFAEFASGPAPNSAEPTREQQGGSQVPPTSLFDDFEPSGNHGHSSIQLESSEAEVWSDFHSAEAPAPSAKFGVEDEELWHQDDFGNDVLFDATAEEPADDDDWGEFESANPTFAEKQREKPVKGQATVSAWNIRKQRATFQGNQTIAPKTPKPVDLLSDHDGAPAHTLPISSGVKYIQDQKLSHKNSQQGEQASLDRNISKLPDLDDEWGDFTDAIPDEPSTGLGGEFRQLNIAKPKEKVPNTSEANPSKGSNGPTPGGPGQLPGPTRSSRSASIDIRPINIPPPFVILQTFAPLLEEFQKQVSIVKPVKGHSRQPSTSSDSNLARDLVCTLRVAARVIAGRTLRWKRDTALSQSTKIGPARSGKPGGMKLSSVNKSESVKEEKEAMDVLDAWRSRASHFNSLILAAGHQIPLISNNMHARPAAANEGALNAAHACALCGLKREERIPKIDEKVEDSFGEWWTEHWGHTDCKSFWDKNSSFLNQRY